MNAGKLLITLAADVASLQSDLNKGSRAVERFSRDVSKQIESVRSAFTTIVGLAGAGSLTAFLKSAVDTADQLGKVAARSGTTVEAFSAINYAAGLADVSTESLGAAMAKLARNADSAARGNQEAKDAFSRLGISVQDAAGRVRGTDQLLADVAKVLGDMPDSATKTALAMSVLGKSGAELIPLLNDNADGFAAITREAQAAGVVISGEASKAAQDFNDNITRLHASMSGLAIGIVGDFLPGINKFVEALKEAWSTSDGFLKSFKALSGAIGSRAYGTDQ